VRKTNSRIFKIILVLGLLVQLSTAFPLTGDNGVVSATVYGVSEGSGYLFVDMNVDQSDYYDIELIDSEDRVYEPSDENGFDSFSEVRHDGFIRDTVAFKVPASVEIKRIKVTPKKSDPFMIEWNGVPESVGSGTRLRFYGATSALMTGGLFGDAHLYKWTFDVKLTNEGNNTRLYGTDNFSMRDTTGWAYHTNPPYDERKLLPGESIRFPVTFKRVGEFSRPAVLMFGDLSMNIEAWT